MEFETVEKPSLRHCEEGVYERIVRRSNLKKEIASLPSVARNDGLLQRSQFSI